jgi:hypothetical protein
MKTEKMRRIRVGLHMFIVPTTIITEDLQSIIYKIRKADEFEMTFAEGLALKNMYEDDRVIRIE